MSSGPPSSNSPNDSAFDFIIVGSGAGGAPLAARLIEKDPTCRVLVLEAGPDQGAGDPTTPAREITDVPVLHGPSNEHADVSWEFFVKHYDRPAKQDPKWHQCPTKEKCGIFYPRASGLGGCTIHNAMITAVGPPSDWNELAWFLDDPSWSAEVMRPYFQLLEHCEFLAPAPLPRTNWGRAWHHLRWLFGKDLDPTGGKHGFGGWLHTSIADLNLGLSDPLLLKMLLAAATTSAWAGLESPKRFVKKALRGEAIEELDPNFSRTQDERPEGLVLTPTAIYGPNTASRQNCGRRCSPRDRLRALQAKHPDRLVIATDCLVRKVIIQSEPNGGYRAIGVEYLHGSKLYRADPVYRTQPNFKASPKPNRIHARREVILAGGAFNTPQLLMLSGIGPKEHLESKDIGIECLVDSPGVGSNLQDRYEVTVVSQMAGNFSLLDGATLVLPEDPAKPDGRLAEWRQNGGGLYASNGTVLGILKRSRPELVQPDLFIFGIPLKFLGYSVGFSKVPERDLFTWAILKSHTSNRDGRVRLRSKDPQDTPDINFHYFQEHSRPGLSDKDPDLQALVHAVKFVRQIGQRAGSAVLREAHPGTVVQTDDQLRQWIKRDAWGHHACGTCRMGRSNDPRAVLDSEFRVLGPANGSGQRSPLRGLRVVDASIFPKIPGYFIVTNIYMASEKAADAILGL
ncbi:MAG: GMC family oxidoreductase N-terminal domain-containing protein [Verrucomicrobiales bacterium]|nr:GMC family oxidoreductase N-terminal domain-containing protein [Verrucomicrobiales bacterium]